jgi:hypothetical protein
LGKKLHIICFDIPHPPDYGGVIDVFYKLKYLHQIGVEIILHCFQYGERKANSMLNKYCSEVYYYPRKIGLPGLHVNLPYIVSSRKSDDLLKNLLMNDAPILFEGIHTTYYSNHPALAIRKKILRAHNIESEYYHELAKNTNQKLKRIYYFFEANRLRKYESNLQNFSIILPISESDYSYFKGRHPHVSHFLIPAFHANQHIGIKPGLGKYCLYHGNLSVEENIKSAQYLVHEIFSKVEIPLIIAGKNPTQAVTTLEGKNVKLISNPDESSLAELIQNAQINVLPSFQQTGLKLKLLNALFLGRHCIVNNEVESNLSTTVCIARSNELFIQKIKELMSVEFGNLEIEERAKCLEYNDNLTNAKAISDFL